MSLLAGLDKLGLKNLESMDLYEDKDAAEQQKAAEAKSKVPEVKETDFLFQKTYECPVCGSKFHDVTVKANRARLLRTEMDLRPVFEGIEPLKYEAILCPTCGYTALGRYFNNVTAAQAKAIRENISAVFHGSQEEKETLTLEEALERNKLCLANAIVKKSKVSEKAYICLKGGWLLQCMEEALDTNAPDYKERYAELKAQEKEYMQNALEGFVNARQNEGIYPMCGMDEVTVDYLVAVLAMNAEQFEVSSKLISNILTSPSASPRIKEKARDVKEALIVRIKEKSVKK